MNSELTILTITAASLGFFHTLFGPDHYLPFIVMSRARGWSKLKTMWITFFCGLGHVLSSVVLGSIGVVLGITVTKLTALESFRGGIAAWLLIVFGLVYFIWGLRRGVLNKAHQHKHFHYNGTIHSHEHVHANGHAHPHINGEAKKSITPWVLFTIFVLGPCEPLIPVLMYPAAKNSMLDVVIVATVFSVITIGTMLSVVYLGSLGIKFLSVKPLERFMHAIAGATILLSGLGMQLLGL
ncbi:MAG: sulfite exporter TauE/SafE family protein [Verrucomicrobia bacterium]|nr:sulfite exporter TauE/SafE family protein [Verrucomicrobiota bacterium]MCF7707397.1 sulfite exporter TauE/SafE family protein [Verrucomicrobiota bacterium]